MLCWRMLLGILIVATLVGLCWLDHAAEMRGAAVPGVWLLPVAILFTLAATDEILRLAKAGGLRPLAWPVYLGNLLLIAGNWVPSVCCDNPTRTATWPLLALLAGFLLVLISETRRYEKPGGATANVAASVLALVYVGLLLGLVVQLRMAFGVAALASLIIVVKLGDTGAYTVGRLIGRHKMAPRLSPGKTIEGAAGALVFACLGSCAVFYWLVPAMSKDAAGGGPWRWILFGLLVAAAGMLGDLAESLIKRDVGRKDSSTWLPGFGGVLDILDSILLAAPVAWICWAMGLVGQ